MSPPESNAGSDQQPIVLHEDPRLQKLADAVYQTDERDTWYSGTRLVPTKDLYLFYGKDDQARRIHVPTADHQQLQHLADTCCPATFGLNQQDVYDETYRKAGRLEVDNFSIGLSPERMFLAEDIKRYLLDWEDETSCNSILIQPYKLNVYGQGCFFKAHQDTPRDERMFGSLVIILPTPHEGGGLRLKHRDKETICDFAGILKGQPEGTVAFCAFYSDVEHEIFEVTSGHRISLTYNLYFLTSSAPSRRVPSEVSILKTAVHEALDDPTFMPEGGHLGFGLLHAYPIRNFDIYDRHGHPGTVGGGPIRVDLYYIWKSLKGADAALVKVWGGQAGAHVSLQLVYDFDRGPNFKVLCPFEPSLGDSGNDSGTEDMFQEMRDMHQGRVIETDGTPEEYGGKVIDIEFVWVTPETETTRTQTEFITFGNEASADYLYANVALIVDVGPYVDGKRLAPDTD